MRTRFPLLSVLNYVMLVVFALGAVVQYNDPDPIPWMLIYGAAAFACALFARGRAHWAVPAAVAAVAFVWGAMLAPEALGVRFGEMVETFQMKDPRVEVGREMWGLTLIFVWMAVLAVVTWRARPSVSAPTV